MNIFSEDAFLEVFSQVYFSNQKATPALFELEGKIWKLPSINSNKPIKNLAFFDFFEAVNELDANDKLLNNQFKSKKVHYLPRVSQRMVTYSEWIEQKLHQSFEPAPTVLWTQFENWDAFICNVKWRRSRLFVDSLRKQRKLEKELGSLEFVFDDSRLETLEMCFLWKSEYLRRRCLPNRFTNPKRLHLFKELSAKQLLKISTLSAKKQLLAIYIFMVNKDRLYLWNTAYNVTYSQYSPGRLLLHFLLEQSFKLQHKEFDFLRGNQDYKWYYATHTRLIEDIGRRPLSRNLHHFLKKGLKKFPGVEMALKQLYNEVISSW